MSDHLRCSILQEQEVANGLQVHHAHLFRAGLDDCLDEGVKILIRHDLSEDSRPRCDVIEKTGSMILHLVLLLVDQLETQADHPQAG